MPRAAPGREHCSCEREMALQSRADCSSCCLPAFLPPFHANPREGWVQVSFCCQQLRITQRPRSQLMPLEVFSPPGPCMLLSRMLALATRLSTPAPASVAIYHAGRRKWVHLKKTRTNYCRPGRALISSSLSRHQTCREPVCCTLAAALREEQLQFRG